jgi:hypothetical protein
MPLRRSAGNLPWLDESRTPPPEVQEPRARGGDGGRIARRPLCGRRAPTCEPPTGRRRIDARGSREVTTELRGVTPRVQEDVS